MHSGLLLLLLIAIHLLMKKTINQRKFIVVTFDEVNDEYSKKFANDHEIEYKLKSIQFSIAFEIN